MTAAGFMSGTPKWVEAALKGDEQTLSANPGLINANDRGWTVLHYSAYWGHDKLVARLLVEAPHLIPSTCFGETALHCAVSKGHDKVVAQLLAASPQLVDIVSLDGSTPLHFAALYGRAQVARQLLAASPALIDRVDNDGRTALHDAMISDQEAVVELLAQAKPDLVFAADRHGDNILHFLSTGCTREFVEKVLRWNPSALHQVNKKLQTPLHRMVLRGNDCAVDVMQWSFCIDDIVSAFVACKKKCDDRMWPVVMKQCEGLLAYLIRDVVELVCEYVISPPNRRR